MKLYGLDGGRLDTVVTKEIRTLVRSRSIVALSTAFVAYALLASYLVGRLAQVDPSSTADTATFVEAATGRASVVTVSLVSLLGMASAYAAVVGERESGTLRFLLVQSYSRMEVVVGKLVGRSAILVGAVATGFLFGGVYQLLYYDDFAFTSYLGFVALTALLGVSYVGVALGFSTAFRSRSRAVAGVVGFFLVATLVWDTGLAARATAYFTTGSFTDLSRRFDYLSAVSPNVAYREAAAGLLEGFDAIAVFSITVLLLWTVLPPALGYLRFRGTEV